MKIGVIIPAYNQAAYLPATIRSLLQQTHKQWEAVIVDDGSEPPLELDNDLVQGSEGALTLIRKENGGVASARNRGWATIRDRVDAVIFLDGDDVLFPTALELLGSALERNPEAGFVISEPRIVDQRGHETGAIYPYRRWACREGHAVLLGEDEPWTPLEAIYCLACPLPSTALVRMDAIDFSPPFDETFGHGREDSDFFLRMALQWKCYYVSDKVVGYRTHEGQHTQNLQLYADQAQKFYEKWDYRKLTGRDREQLRRAEHFRQGPHRIRQGIGFGLDRFRKGDFAGAMRFWLGALRRSPAEFWHVASNHRQEPRVR